MEGDVVQSLFEFGGLRERFDVIAKLRLKFFRNFYRDSVAVEVSSDVDALHLGLQVLGEGGETSCPGVALPAH